MKTATPRPAAARVVATRMHPGRGMTAVLALFSLLLVLAASAAALSIVEGWRSAGYREVSGTVLSVGIGRVERNAPGKDRQRSRTSSSRYLHVRYRYEVDGVSYEGDRLQPGTFGMTSADSLKRFGDRFGEGSTVAVFVDPSDPHTAVLVTGWSSVTTLLCVLTGVFAVMVMILRPLRRALLSPPRAPARR